jgi:hypothetical protein
MRQKLLNDFKELPTDSSIIGFGPDMNVGQMRNEIEAQTTVGKEFIEMMVEEGYGNDEDEESDLVIDDDPYCSR